MEQLEIKKKQKYKTLYVNPLPEMTTIITTSNLILVEDLKQLTSSRKRILICSLIVSVACGIVVSYLYQSCMTSTKFIQISSVYRSKNVCTNNK